MDTKQQDLSSLSEVGQSFAKEETWSVEKQLKPLAEEKDYADMNDVEKAIYNTKDSKLNKDLSLSLIHI